MTAARYAARAVLGALLVCAAMLPLLSGCSLYNRVFHRGAKTVAAARSPFARQHRFATAAQGTGGLSAPDTRNAVKIPRSATPERIRSQDRAVSGAAASFSSD